MFFKWLKKKSGILSSPIIETIPIKEMNDGFKKWRKATSTPPTWRHLGHYTFLLALDLSDDDCETEDFKTIM